MRAFTASGQVKKSLSIPQALSVTTIELGHANDTTLARSAAGQVSVEGTRVMLDGDVMVCEGRLTLAVGHPYYNPQPATPSATDTGTEVLTFASAHGWTTGTQVVPDDTVGGLTSGTTYYVNAISPTTISLHTTISQAEADTSRVNLTASVTSILRPVGVRSKSLRFEPFNGNRVRVFNGTNWVVKAFSSLTLSLTTTINTLYYVYLDDDAVTLSLSTTAYTLQDGVRVMSGDTTKLFLGWLFAVGTDAGEDSQIHRGLINWYNQRPLRLFTCPGYANDSNTTTYNFTNTSWAALNGGTGASFEFVSDGVHPVRFAGYATYRATAASDVMRIGVGYDSTSVSQFATTTRTPGTNDFFAVSGGGLIDAAEGKHTLNFLGHTNTPDSLLIHADLNIQTPDAPATYMEAEVWG